MLRGGSLGSPPDKPNTPMNDILVLAAHPALAHSRVNRALIQAAKTLPGVHLRDLYALYPDYLIDVAAEQSALQAARLVVWLHPVQWYAMPALMKLWLDEVFSFGWAYGPGGTQLQGKSLWLVLSTGGPLDSYQPEGHNRHALDDFLLPYRQTAHLAGMQLLPALVLHGAHSADEVAIASHVRHFVELLHGGHVGHRAAPDDPPGAATDSAVPASCRPFTPGLGAAATPVAQGGV